MFVSNLKFIFMRKPYKRVIYSLMMLLSLGLSLASYGQLGTIQIGSGTATINGGAAIPVTNFNYTYSQQLVTAAEYVAGGGAATGQITKIRYYCTSVGTASVWNNWTVFIGNTTKTSFTSDTDWVPLAQLTQVFSGTITPVANNWFEITFTAPFNYTGGNIVVAIDENAPGWNSSPTFRSYTSTANSGIQYRDDNVANNPDPASPPTANNRVAALPQLQFEGTLPTCIRPSALTLGSVSSASANITWTAGGTETNWNIQWGTPGFTPGTGTQIGSDVSTVASATINGLTQLTSYDIYVQADCGAGDVSLWRGPLNITTIQTPVTLPYTDDFSANNWILNNGSQTNKWFVGAADGNPANSLYISNDAGGATTTYGHTTSVVRATKTIAFTAGSNPFELSFDWKAGGEGSSDYLRVWIVPATATLAAGTQINTTNTPGALQLGGNLNLQATWKTNHYMIPASYAGTNAKLVFEWRNDGSGGTTTPSIVVDNVNVKSSTCPPPTALAVASVSSASANTTWTAGGTETNWNIQWGAPGFTPGTGTQIGSGTSTVASYTVNGLTQLTSYDIYVQADCGAGDVSFWVGPLNITTIQTPVTLPYTDDFSANNWILNNGSQTNKWFVGAADGNPANSLYISNDAGGATTTYGHTTSVVRATKTIAFTAGSNPFELSFDWKAGGESSSDYLRVWIVPATATLVAGTQINTTNTPGALQLGGNLNLQATWKTNHYMIPASYAGTNAKLVFEWRNDGGGGTTTPSIVVDNVNVKSSTCPPPTALAATPTSVNSMNVSWTAGGTETAWTVVWGTPGFTPGGSGQLGTQNFTSTSGPVSTLTANTNYEVYVRADCGSGDLSLWTGPVSIYTGYCTPSYTNTSDYTSSFVTTGAYSNVSYSATTQPATGYANQTGGTPIVSSAGSTFNFSHSYVGGENTVRIWVDWNNNLVFEASEQVYQQYNGTSPYNQSGSIAIPAGTPNGNYRMRVRSRYYTTVPGACSSESYGSAIDFTLAVITPPSAPAITQAAGTPNCTDGTDLTVTGTPAANETWYWQTTATGTSTANNATTPWTVYQNGTYYVRSLNTVYNIWSTANSVTVTNVPTAPTPPTPVAAQNPACTPGTDIVVPTATGGLEYYWQGTSNTSSSTANNASAPYAVTATGTYYVKAFDPATGCWSAPQGLLVTVDTYIPAAPTANPAVYTFCTSDSPMDIAAQVPVVTGTCTATNNAAGSDGSGVTATVNNFSCAQGTITGATMNATIVSPSGTSWCSSGWYSYNIIVNGTTVATDQCNLTGFNLTPYLPLTSVSIVSNDDDSDPGDQVTLTLTVNITYSNPAPSINWYDAATAGNNLGSGATLNTLGTSVIPTSTVGQYEFYAGTMSGGCASATRTLVTVNISDVNVELTAIDASCNNGNDGSFTVADTLCGTAPFTYAIDGGAFGALPTDLVAGTHTVTVRDANGNESAEYTITIGSAAGPSGVVVNSFDNDEANISWVAGGSETQWNIEWGAPGFTPGTGTAVGTATATDTTYTITGLDGDTEYDIYVSANCGTGTTAGDWAATDVLTDCDPMPAAGYCEDFEDIAALGCWRVLNENGDGDVWGIYTGYANSGTQSAGIYTDYNAGNNNDYLVLPRLTLTGNEVMTFHYRARSSSEPNDYRVVLSTTGYEAADFTNVLLTDTVNNTVYNDTMINLSAYTGDVYIAFHVPQGGLDGYYLYIDDVCFDVCIPNPGTDGTTDVCRTTGTVDLDGVITSDYSNGSWVHPANQSIINGSTMNVSTLANGSYDVLYVVTTACTSDTTVATINVVNPSSAGNDGLITTCKNQMIDLYGGLSGTVDFGGTWYRPNGTAMTSSYFQTGTVQGQSTYTYIVSNGPCGPDTAQVVVNIQNCDFLGLEDVSLLENVSVAPNPNSGQFQIIGIPGTDYVFEILDLNGRVIRSSKKIVSSVTDVNLTDVEDGVYMIRISGNNSERMMRVVKQH